MAQALATRLLFTCGREPAYIRNTVLLKALALRYKVIPVTESVRFLPLRYLKLFLRLAVFKQPVNGVLVGFYGQPLMLLVNLLSHSPILFDAYISTYDTLCFDRKRFKTNSIVGRVALWLDRKSCALADEILLDTQAHVDYFQHTLGVPKEKLHSLFVGCNEDIFYRRPEKFSPVEGQVLTVSSFMPIHGTNFILEAANLLRNDHLIKFHLIGEGMELKRMRQLAEHFSLSNVSFSPSMPPEQLADEISKASICLGGHFGTSEKASRVIASKTYIFTAMGKATIVGDNPANQELLTHGQDAYACKMADPAALADAIRTLMENAALRKSLGENARQTFLERASLPVLSQQLQQIVEKLVNSD